ncbi:hypothetical protein [Aeromonas veronii]|uniref:hypothetical protein n=1 Tax=Aeromonas veronii TaxID=654 RepID=UPI0029371C3B|nr:hypothetical protein [Aeromonas veronii]WOE85839.1 hypothetical protein RY930_05435 [Aeromonas veronii]
MKKNPDQKPALDHLLAQCDETAPMPQELIEWEQAEGFSRYDSADYLDSEEDIAAYIEAAEEEDDPALMVLRARERLANPLQGIKVTLDEL